MNTQEIKAKYQKLHNELGSRKDALNKEQFDIDHAKVWADCDAELKARKVDLLAKSKLTAEEQVELKDLQIMFPEPLPPSRDIYKEIDALKAKVAELEKKVK